MLYIPEDFSLKQVKDAIIKEFNSEKLTAMRKLAFMQILYKNNETYAKFTNILYYKA